MMQRNYQQIILVSAGGDQLPGGKKKPKTSVYPNGVGPQGPAWVAYDRQVCASIYTVQRY